MKKIFMFIGCLSLSLYANDLKKGNEIDLSQFQDKTIEKQIQLNQTLINKNEPIQEITFESNSSEILNPSNTFVENIPQNQVISIENIKNEK